MPDILLPGPLDVFEAFVNNIDEIFQHTLITLLGALGGCFLAAVVSFFVSIVMIMNKTADRAIMSLVIILKTFPIVVIAPIIAVYIGSGILHKITISYLICFLPILMSLSAGLRSVDSQLLKYLEVIKAKKMQVVFRVRVPAAMPHFFVGLKIGIPLSFVGAIVGEMVVPRSGLGYLIGLADNQFLVDYQYAIIIWLGLISFMTYNFFVALECLCVYWKKDTK